MEMLVPTTPEVRWETIARTEFNLTPKELATLAAIVAFVDQLGAPMPRDVLERAAANPLNGPVDMTTPGRLHRLGLVELLGYREDRYYRPTDAGRERLKQ